MSSSDPEANERAERERAAAAASGVPVQPAGPGSDTDDGNFKHPIATKGDVTVYTPVRSRDGLTVPVEIKNTGAKRAFYKVDVRVQGADGFDVMLHVDTDTVGVYPGTSWPVEATAKAQGKPLPDRPHVTIEKVTREEFRG
ncbi:hypothetical protein [Streptomyces sp. NBC_00503]|uniref:hypothetical protein n=1 Tax=Streptomyces sp. NBC_00503 TaxID=2903659 RepID=UPI002E807EF5|nr:hypothetical protein [Streptomyces sp. NBC_00503]WUD81055.1 hypothetical protein OG490_11135 [Streptomyces sp. NBC_00503]